MANQEHLAKLEEGVVAWHQWKSKHADVVPDLSGADLSGADLLLANLVRADLSRANLSGADLRGARLVGANLEQASLGEANLAGAFLEGANLSGASLIWANLSGAFLQGANLTGADLALADLRIARLDGADFHEAKLGETVFPAADLSTVKGLDTCKHYAPSTIDHRTLAISGSLPLAFLRGCGLPDALITYLPSLLNQPIQFYSCFISYSTKDQKFADRIHVDLQNKGVRCWFAPEDLKIGDQFRQRIDEAIRLHEKLLVILSRYSVRSDWVREEVESCLEREHREKRPVLFPVRLDDAVMDTDAAWAASIRRQRHIGDFSDWRNHDSYQKAFDRLLKDLKAEAERADMATGQAD
jgi:uncharacterized protein YjbI with pentapeptide repeats